MLVCSSTRGTFDAAAPGSRRRGRSGGPGGPRGRGGRGGAEREVEAPRKPARPGQPGWELEPHAPPPPPTMFPSRRKAAQLPWEDGR